MLEYQTVGALIEAGTAFPLLLPRGRPLSYLRVSQPDRISHGLTRALLERRATEFRVRIPLALKRDSGRRLVVDTLERAHASTTFPVLDGSVVGRVEVDLCWLDWVQLTAVGRAHESGFERSAATVEVAGLMIGPVYEPSAAGEDILRSWQYWNSGWEFAEPPAESQDWWRVRPNETRSRPRPSWLPGSRSPSGAAQARGTFAACLHPSMRRRLGNPRYIVVGHPHRESWLPVLAIPDEFEGKADEGGELWTNTVFLDRTAREALGIADGEFCLVRPWQHPRGSILWRATRDRLVGSRMIAAHVRSPARADLEKPVCRLEPEALEAIGGEPGERVTIEYLKPVGEARTTTRWERVSLTQRALPIAAAERAERARWESPQLWDDQAAEIPEGPEAPALEGYVDCAERLGVHPPYPTIYLNYHTRRSSLRGVGLCHPVQVRVGVPGRLTAEASEFAWLVVIALLGAAIAFVQSEPWQIAAAAVLALVTVWLVAFRAIQAIR
jgi:hypothetical protein